ncbi:hypothetical protein J2Z83_000368 [Virgibacillus natechei]|uniref:YwpF-like protein n=1 Tax=Virgibacillus natechei TaxID=1216297 RepID=A0ABS4ICW2_9BACI|nr:YwpF family protein [Virgibacillus natechei]MBP1968276.1 hypothetical protein [Virgibacillus natechei]UZD14458.1 YwpF-like family protein [Virgibacillus natechei]
MKTFKLKSLEVMEPNDTERVQSKIELKDGLTINREDDDNQWLIEAYVDQSYLDYFNTLKEEDEITVKVKITKESNDPATFITSIIRVNPIGDHLNVLFIGPIVNRQEDKTEDVLSALIKEGYQGEELVKKFKEVKS